jgi:tetratricopeptide (TPR) repeat protein
MTAINPSEKTAAKHPLREDQVVTLYARALGYFDRNRKVVYGALAAILVVILLIVGYVFYMNRQQSLANEMLTEPVAAYEIGDYQTALSGTAEWQGLLAIADSYGSTDAGNLATFYAADALFQLGEYEQALDLFEAFDAEDNLLGASAVAGQAAVYETQGEFQQAAELYEQAASMYEDEMTTPEYLMDAARAYEQAGAIEQAVEAYEQIQERFPESAQAGTADFFIARAQARQTQPS